MWTKEEHSTRTFKKEIFKWQGMIRLSRTETKNKVSKEILKSFKKVLDK